MKLQLLFISIPLILAFMNKERVNHDVVHGLDHNTSESALKEILGTYIQVERDSLGYLIYKPCDGRTPRIEVTQDSIIVFGQIDFPARLEKFKITEKKGTIRMKAHNIDEIYWNFNWRPVGTEHDLVLVEWKWASRIGSFKQKGRALYAPESNASDMRIVRNKCNSEKVPELQFLPIEFE
jgi:hypothetical protein